MKKLIVIGAAFLMVIGVSPIVKRAWAASCPAGAVCIQFPTYWSTFTYIVTGGNTLRGDYTRWFDNWREMPELGIDCTGATDSATAFQAAIDGMPNDGVLMAPIGCQIKLGTTITIQDRVGIQIASTARAYNCTSSAPQIIWTGGAGPVFNFNRVDHPNVQGFTFTTTNSAATLGTVINIDGDRAMGSATPTWAQVKWNSFCLGSTNTNFRAIAISATSNSNNENYNIEENTISCSSTNATLRSVAGVINSGSPTLVATGAAFVAGDVGKTLLVSYSTGSLSTIIDAVTNSTTVTMHDNAVASKTGASVHVGTSIGTGIYQSGSNAFHTRIAGNNISNCNKGVHIANGSFDIRHIGGFNNDTALYLEKSNGQVNYFDSENDVRAIYLGDSAPFIVATMRLTVANSRADGWIYIPSNVSLTFMASHFEATPTTNWVLFGFGGATGPVTSIGNSYLNAATFTQVNICGGGNVAYINDDYGAAGVKNGYCGSNGLPTSASGLPSGQIWKNSNVLTVVP